MLSTDSVKRIAMKCPFAGNGDRDEIANSATNVVNFNEGFPGVYEAPSANDGKFVTRREMNGALYSATADIFFLKCGKLNTFDKEFAIAINGYPKGAVLKYLYAGQVREVMSLQDNNKYDYTGSKLTPSEISAGIISGGVDDIHWTLCDIEKKALPEISFFSISSIGVTSLYTSLTQGVFNASMNALLGVKTDANLNYGDQDILFQSTFPSTKFFTGFGVFVKDLGTSPSSVSSPTPDTISSWSCVYSSPDLGIAAVTNPNDAKMKVQFSPISQMFVNATENHYYAVCSVFSTYGRLLNDAHKNFNGAYVVSGRIYLNGTFSYANIVKM